MIRQEKEEICICVKSAIFKQKSPLKYSQHKNITVVNFTGCNFKINKYYSFPRNVIEN